GERLRRRRRDFLPFMTLPLYASIERLDPRLLEAGADLYGNPLTVLRKVTLPLTMPGIVAGTLLTFIPAAGDHVNAALLGSTANWANPCGAPDVCEALGNSLKIGVLATVISTVLRTMVAFALGRHRFRGRGNHEPAHLPADGDPRGRDGRVAAHAVPQPRRGP